MFWDYGGPKAPKVGPTSSASAPSKANGALQKANGAQPDGAFGTAMSPDFKVSLQAKSGYAGSILWLWHFRLPKAT